VYEDQVADVPLLGEDEEALDRRPQEGGELMAEVPTPGRGVQLPSDHPLVGPGVLEDADCAADIPASVKEALVRHYGGALPPSEPVPDDVELV
jgi:hypothetical protein